MLLSFATVALVSALSAPFASAAEMTGYLSDHACVSKNVSAKKAMDWIQPAAFEACVKKCVKEGETLVFVTEDNRILKLDAASLAKATPHMGQRVSVKATVTGDTIALESIAVIKMDPKTGAKGSHDDHEHSR